MLEVPALRNLLQQQQQEVKRMMMEKLAAKSPLPVRRHGLCCRIVFIVAVLALLIALAVFFAATFATQPSIGPQFRYWLVKSGIYRTVRMAKTVEF